MVLNKNYTIFNRILTFEENIELDSQFTIHSDLIRGVYVEIPAFPTIESYYNISSSNLISIITKISAPYNDFIIYSPNYNLTYLYKISPALNELFFNNSQDYVLSLIKDDFEDLDVFDFSQRIITTKNKLLLSKSVCPRIGFKVDLEMNFNFDLEDILEMFYEVEELKKKITDDINSIKNEKLRKLLKTI